jgi:hypothetical protein
MKPCTVNGCEAKHLAKGMCRKHYLRMYKTGTFDVKVLRGAPAAERVEAKSLLRADGCLEFQGTLNERGYGQIRDGKMRMAHVVAFESKYGPVPAGRELDHKCRNRACCNPDHLEPVTHQENVRRGLAGQDWPSRPRSAAGQFLAMEKGLI